MSAFRVLYHMARADFLERIRHYSFLIMLGLALFLGYSIASGQLVLVVGQNYRGVTNSAWVGGLMAVMINFFLGLFGFYLVKGSIQRDYTTGVGQIMATTALKRPLYTLGKWLSNLAVLCTMVVVLILTAIIMQMLYREEPAIQWWALLSPFLLLVLPFMALTAALAVFFEAVTWLRGGIGNVVYFFLFTTIIVMLSIPAFWGDHTTTDLMGFGILGNSMGAAAKASYPAYNGSIEITWLVPRFETFVWNGIHWTSEIIVSRVMLLLFSIGITALSAIFFDRFNPSHVLPVRKKKSASPSPEPVHGFEQPPISNVHLTPLTITRAPSRFGTLLMSELKLFLKGQRWWWYAIAAGLSITQFFTGPEVCRILLIAAWLWHILLLSKLGCREKIFDTHQMVFSAPHPIAAQLPAMWLSAFFVTALLGLGALLQFLFTGETFSALGWLVGSFFVPAAALACGVMTGSNKAFEVLYVFWMYMIIKKVPAFDFLGATPESPLHIYALLTFVLLILTIFIRQRQIKESGRGS
jgi:hypothetical protein